MIFSTTAILLLCHFRVTVTASTERKVICQSDSVCSSSETCIHGFCGNPCAEACAPGAVCIVMKHKTYCFCKDDNEDCSLKKNQLKTCVPECGKHSKCNTEIGFCECKSGYQGNPYKGCMKKCSEPEECSYNETCISGVCKSPCQEDCGANSLCLVVDHNSFCSCLPDYSGNPLEICRRNDEALDDICEECGPEAKCQTDVDSRITKCICPRGYVGNPYLECQKMCLSYLDCTADKICVNHVCQDPCLDACGVNALCQVDRFRRKPKCTCKPGFFGDPSRICTLKIETRFAEGSSEDEEYISCHPKCGENATCNTDFGICICNNGFIGNAYEGCHKKCEKNNNCPLNEACFDGDCRDPCIGACGKEALCKVDKHMPICRCPFGFTGNPLQVCEEIPVVTQPTIIEIDLCDRISCGKNAVCGTKGDEKCVCLPGFVGDPYKKCLKQCRTTSECDKEEICTSKICSIACEGSCGINALCKAVDHIPVCSCPDKYKGDSSRMCFPETKENIANPSRVPCIACICKAMTGTDNLFACAEKSISLRYWAFAGENIVGGEDFRTRNSTADFITCMNDRICIINTINDYTSRTLHRLNDIDCDGKITCADYFAVHKFGLTAKFSDSAFEESEAKSFDQCEGHGDKDIHNDWNPRKCTGPSYIEMLS